VLGLALLAALRGALGWWAAIPGAVVLLAGTAAEAVLVLRWLGRVFEGTDPARAGIAA
jgi:hypothetical protein